MCAALTKTAFLCTLNFFLLIQCFVLYYFLYVQFFDSTLSMKSSLHFCTTENPFLLKYNSSSSPVLFYSLNKFCFLHTIHLFAKKIRNSKLHLRICNETCGKRKHLRESIRFMKKEMLMGLNGKKKEFDDFSSFRLLRIL